MSYIHIENLYKHADILQCFALEKVHGTSAHLGYKNGKLRYFASGESHPDFIACFPSTTEELSDRFRVLFPDSTTVVVYGEAFGGKQQGMGDVYGKTLRFLAFDVKVDQLWADVPRAEHLVKALGLGFVPYERGPMTLEWLNQQRDLLSAVAVVPDAKREGIVVRPIHESTYNDGSRMIFKHKTEAFRETRTPRDVTPEKLAVLTEAGAIADEWITPMRLDHVLQRAPYKNPLDTPTVIKTMIEDIKREAADEIVWSKDVAKAVSRATMNLLQERFHVAKASRPD